MKITPEMIAEDELRWHARDVITELGYCGNAMRDRKDMTNLDIRFYAYIMRKAHEMLKAREPRVMTLEEVCNLKYDDVVYYQGINTNSVESAIVLHGEKMVPEVNTRVVQFRHADGTGGWNGINNADLNGYGKKWWCWTAKPTPEQMRNTPWKGENDA